VDIGGGLTGKTWLQNDL